jgi:hypothetical protein
MTPLCGQENDKELQENECIVTSTVEKKKSMHKCMALTLQKCLYMHFFSIYNSEQYWSQNFEKTSCGKDFVTL